MSVFCTGSGVGVLVGILVIASAIVIGLAFGLLNEYGHRRAPGELRSFLKRFYNNHFEWLPQFSDDNKHSPEH